MTPFGETVVATSSGQNAVPTSSNPWTPDTGDISPTMTITFSPDADVPLTQLTIADSENVQSVTVEVFSNGSPDEVRKYKV